MRTRRSPRNQDRLFKYLFKPEEKRVTPIVTPCCFNCCNYPKQGRDRGACTLIGKMVMGTSQKPCFVQRKESL